MHQIPEQWLLQGADPTCLALCRGGIWAPFFRTPGSCLGAAVATAPGSCLGTSSSLGAALTGAEGGCPGGSAARRGKEGLQGMLCIPPVRLHTQGTLHPADSSSLGRRKGLGKAKAVLESVLRLCLMSTQHGALSEGTHCPQEASCVAVAV